MSKKIKIEISRRRYDSLETRNRVVEMTLTELIEYFGYTLEVGHSWDKKVNKNPKSGRSLVNALNRAEEARAANGCPSVYYSIV